MDVPEEGFFARIDHLHRAPGAQRQETDLHLHAEVFTGPEGTPHAGEVQPHLFGWQCEACRDLGLVDVQPLGGDVQVDAAVIRRDRQPRLRAHEGLILHAGLVAALDDDCSCCAGIAPADPLAVEDVAVRMDRGGLGRGHRVDDRLRRVVVDDDGGGGAPSGLGVVGGHAGDGLTHVTDHVPGEDRLVRVVESVRLQTGDVLGGDHRTDAGDLQRLRNVDAADRGGGMRRAHEVAPQHAFREQIGGERELPEDLRDAVRSRRTLAEPAAAYPEDRAHP